MVVLMGTDVFSKICNAVFLFKVFAVSTIQVSFRGYSPEATRQRGTATFT